MNWNHLLILMGQFALISRVGYFTPPRLSAPGPTGEVKNLIWTEAEIYLASRLAGTQQSLRSTHGWFITLLACVLIRIYLIWKLTAVGCNFSIQALKGEMKSWKMGWNSAYKHMRRNRSCVKWCHHQAIWDKEVFGYKAFWNNNSTV